MSILYDNLEQVRAALLGAGLHAVVDDVLALRKEAIGLAPSDTPEVGTAWGDPVLPDDAPWPRFNGRPMTHLAQLDLGALPTIDSWPHQPRSGSLVFFAEISTVFDHTFGTTATDQGLGRIMYVGDRQTSVRRHPADHSDLEVYPERPYNLACAGTGWSLPPPWGATLQALTGDRHDAYPLDELWRLQMAGVRHHLLGYPEPWQFDPCEQAAAVHHEPADAWVSLFEFSNQAVGTHYYTIRTADLAKRDYAQAWFEWQCD